MEKCPNCGTESPPNAAYCDACGHILPAALKALEASGQVTLQLDGNVYESLEPRRRWGTAYFAQQGQVEFKFRDSGSSLAFAVSNEIVVGRKHDEPSVAQPDVDLGPFGAQALGVSRQHLKLTRSLETIMVIDLGSANSTYLNGQRMIPYEPRILRDNDELRLGRMVIRVAFI